MAVVAADKLEHLLALGVGTHKPQHRQAGLRAGADEADHLHRGDKLDDHLGQDIL